MSDTYEMEGHCSNCGHVKRLFYDYGQTAKHPVECTRCGCFTMWPRPPAHPNRAAVELGRLGGSKGGNARAQSLTPERRSEIARHAARTRWSRVTAPPSSPERNL